MTVAPATARALRERIAAARTRGDRPSFRRVVVGDDQQVIRLTAAAGVVVLTGRAWGTWLRVAACERC
jgi:hypothetical protein